MVPRLVIHGGAGKRPSEKRQREIKKALEETLREAYPVLLEGGGGGGGGICRDDARG